MWNAIISFVRKLPVAQYLKPIWKGALKKEIEVGVEILRAKIKARVAAGVTTDIDSLFSDFQAWIDNGIDAAPIPAWAKSTLRAADSQLDAQLDHARLMMDAAIADKAPGAIDLALDNIKAILNAQIDAL